MPSDPARHLLDCQLWEQSLQACLFSLTITRFSVEELHKVMGVTLDSLSAVY